MEWGKFSDTYPRAHLISGEYNPMERWRCRERFSALGNLVVALNPAGQWAINKMARSGESAIYVVYVEAVDALMLRRAVGAVKASPPVRHKRWITHHNSGSTRRCGMRSFA